MGYLLPGVRVEQILRRPNANLVDVDLFPTLVGPVFRVIRRRKIKPQGPIPVNLNGPAYSFTFPILDPGAQPDGASVEIWLRDAWGEFLKRTSGANYKSYQGKYLSGFLCGLNYFVDETVDFLQSGIQRGDRLWVGTVGSGNGYLIIDKVEQHKLFFRQTIYKTIPDDAGVPANVVGYTILRFFENFQLDPLDYRAILTTNTVEVDVFAYVTYDSLNNPVSHPFITGQIETSYRALRRDLTGLKRYENSEAVQKDMESDVWNPLGFALCRGTFMANGNTRPVLAYLLDEDSDSAYIDALGDLATYRKTYLLVPMTLSSQVVNAFAAHVTHMSSQEISYFRILFASRKLTTEDTILPTVGSTAEVNG